jgi:iron complex outermembrane recepter protein
MVSRSFDNARKRKEYLWLGTSFSVMALCVTSRTAQAEEGNAAAARGVSPIVVAQQQPTPVPDVSVTAPKKKPPSGAPKKRSTRTNTGATNQPGPATAPAAPSAQPATPGDGSVAAGYRVDTIKNIGPFADMKLQDTPYSFNVISSDFIDNTLSYATPGGGALEKSPFYYNNSTDQRPVVGEGASRATNGYSANNFFRIDGLSVPTTSSTYGTEQYDRIEILSGVSGFMYGVSSAAGGVNYVTKQPTTTPYASLTIGAPNGDSGYIHADVGGTSANGQFGYRLNMVGQDGYTFVDGQNQQRAMFSGAFTYRPTETSLLEFDGWVSHYEVHGGPALYVFQPGVQIPAAPDPTKNWSEPYTHLELTTSSVGTRYTTDINDWMTLRTGWRYINEDWAPSIVATNFIGQNGTYSQHITFQGPVTNEAYSGYTYVDFKFDTPFVPFLKQKLTVGWTGQQDNYIVNINNIKSDTFTGFSLTNPTYVSNPDLVVGNSGNYRQERIIQRTYSVGDQIDIGRYFSFLLGGSLTTIGDTYYDTSNTATYGYDASALTPTYAFLFKPTDGLTTYVSYVEGLQEGQVVTDPVATNYGAILPPYLRKQYEIGAKATVGNVLLTLAYFNINSALSYSIVNADDTDTYFENGRQVSKGVEFSATGKIAEGTRVLGGFQFANSKVTSDPANPSFVGTVPQGAVTNLQKITLEQDLPFLPGWTLTGGAYHTGGQYRDQANTQWMSGRTTFDAGVRYTTKVDGHDVIARFYVSNLTNESYWLGTTVGDPRRFSASLQWRF